MSFLELDIALSHTLQQSGQSHNLKREDVQRNMRETRKRSWAQRSQVSVQSFPFLDSNQHLTCSLLGSRWIKTIEQV